MPATITDVVRVGVYAWRYDFTGTAPFRVYRDGRLAQNSDATSYVAEWGTDTTAHRIEPPQIEVIDSTQTTAALSQTLYPPFVTIQFRGRTTNAYYLVEVSTNGGSSYSTLSKIMEDGSGYYQSNSLGYTATDLLFRVTPYDSEGTAGDPLSYSVFHYGYPDPPSLTYTYAAGTGLLTIAAA